MEQQLHSQAQPRPQRHPPLNRGGGKPRVSARGRMSRQVSLIRGGAVPCKLARGEGELEGVAEGETRAEGSEHCSSGAIYA